MLECNWSLHHYTNMMMRIARYMHRSSQHHTFEHDWCRNLQHQQHREVDCHKPPANTHMRPVPHSSCPASRPCWLQCSQKAPEDTIHIRRLCCHPAHGSPRPSIRRSRTRRIHGSLPGRRRALDRSGCSLDRMRTSRHRGRLYRNCRSRSLPHTPHTRWGRFVGTRGCTCSRAPGWRLRGTGRWLGRKSMRRSLH